MSTTNKRATTLPTLERFGALLKDSGVVFEDSIIPINSHHSHKSHLLVRLRLSGGYRQSMTAHIAEHDRHE
jgi:hypothetical protein